MRIALAQINPIIADIEGNARKIIRYIGLAKDTGADLVVFPELATIGYPPMDLLERDKLIDDNLAAAGEIARHADGIAVICGMVEFDVHNKPMLFNTAAFMENGHIQARYHKVLLPTYDVFDELRYFSPGRNIHPFTFMGKKIGTCICEDIWNDSDYESSSMELRRYPVDPVRALAALSIDVLINISASPYVKGKNTVKWEMISGIARRESVPILYVNQVGGNDSLVFDGNSFFLNARGEFIARARGFEEDLVVVDLDIPETIGYPVEDELEDVRRALVLGLRDYVRKCGFSKVVIGLSGGIDSALTAAIAAQALGPENVTGITMPSVYSSRGSVDDSAALARNLGIRVETIPIMQIFDSYRSMLKPVFSNMPEDVAEENIQARIRGNLLMAASNKFGSMLLTTGNKSELAMGYCTLYGDMSGGLAVISDLPKTLVYRLAYHVNRDREIIPVATIEKPPSAELRENQKDEDSLPPYALLDQILELYIEKMNSAGEIIALGYPAHVVRDVLAKVDRNEYKRRQGAPGLKITSKAFGSGRRIPIAQRYKP
ncbi:MAG: NAD+ synthase [Spirochaetes bacterium]|nr:MAG: NAD+ synthase [Spirochaetota bacterium]